MFKLMRKSTLRIAFCSGLLLLTSTLYPAVAGVDAQESVAYQPPQFSQPVLGKIVDSLRQATPVDQKPFSAHPPTFIGTLPGGALYFEVSTMDVDDDGGSDGSPTDWVSHPVRGGHIDNVHQDQVSYPAKTPISPFNVPYIVLPGGTPTWWRAQKIHIGDGAVVIRGDRRINAVFADSGPGNKVGEMSIKAHQLFGETVAVPGKKPRLGPDGTPLKDSKTAAILTDPATVTRNSASKGPFIVIVFPGTSAGPKFVSVEASLQPAIDRKFDALVKGTAEPPK
jgi:Fungal chitosanase of glycosyl hydrolase group 75